MGPMFPEIMLYALGGLMCEPYTTCDARGFWSQGFEPRCARPPFLILREMQKAIRVWAGKKGGAGRGRVPYDNQFNVLFARAGSAS